MWLISREKRRRGSRGFSFLEILIAVVITSFLGAALYGTFSQGLRLWRWSLGISTETDRYIFFEKIQEDLRNALPFGFEGFEGSADRIRFFALRTGAVPSENGGGSDSVPVQVTYRFDPEGRRIMRREEPLTGVLLRGPEETLFQEEGGTEIPERILAEGVAGMEFTFFKEKTSKKSFFWSQRWEEPCPPEAVRIKLKYDDDLREKYSSRVVSIPSRRCSQKERA